mgnify:CR=1 FL=1
MKVEVRYGDGIVSLNIPDANLGRVIRPWQDEQPDARIMIVDGANKIALYAESPAS